MNICNKEGCDKPAVNLEAYWEFCQVHLDEWNADPKTPKNDVVPHTNAHNRLTKDIEHE